MTWRPAAPRETLERRAAVLAPVRAFFAARGVLEVETPLLGRRTTSDPAIESVAVTLADGTRGWLQTSPEHAMKRLLAAGSGPIYEITRSFRAGEHGRLHNVEFTILEWYRPGFDHHRLMDEVAALVEEVLGVTEHRRISYDEALREGAAVDGHDAPVETLADACAKAGVDRARALAMGRDAMLDLLLAERVQPALGPGLVHVHDFPASKSALARVRPGTPPLAERFEAFVDGIELANGYHELTDAHEQARRFAADRARRAAAGLTDVEPDERLLDALEHGLPACAGVALGLDRLAMLAAGASDVAAVIAFPFEHA